jgi:hypothetical protein
MSKGTNLDVPLTGVALREDVQVFLNVLPSAYGEYTHPELYAWNRRLQLIFTRGSCDGLPEIGAHCNIKGLVSEADVGSDREVEILVQAIDHIEVQMWEDGKRADLSLVLKSGCTVQYRLKDDGRLQPSYFFRPPPTNS